MKPYFFVLNHYEKTYFKYDKIGKAWTVKDSICMTIQLMLCVATNHTIGGYR